MNDQHRKPIFLVINADDFGYYACISRGIVACARSGAVTATAIMANGPRFAELVKLLPDTLDIDLGVHLNITYGLPISKECRRLLALSGGCFKTKMATAVMLMQNKLTAAAVKAEWRAQIDRSLAAGLKICFLNSHEHIHILPAIAGLMPELSKEYGIRYIRNPRPEWKNQPKSISALLRNLLMGLAVWSSSVHSSKPDPRVLGVGVSGKMTIEYLDRCFRTLIPGGNYELMCHPGIYDPNEIVDKRLTKFHAWQQEMDLLMSDTVKALLRRYNIRLKRFSELDQGNTKTNSLSEIRDF
jgi:predicted glycoside hydrolase/deacetylase ChbG (UPF0249 family)